MDVRHTHKPSASARVAPTQPSAKRWGAGVSLVIPAYNEQETIEQAIREADEALAGLTSDYEILVVDDGSRDETAAIVRREAESRPAVRLLQQPGNQGYGAALRRGFQEAVKPLVAFTDADCQFDLRELDRLTRLSEHYDIACGYRIDRQDPWPRKLYSQGYNMLARLLLGTGVRDCDCALKVFRREVVQSIPLQTNGFFINAELLTKARLGGHSVVEVGVTHRPRPRGQSTVSVLHALPVATTLVRFWWNTVLFPQPTRAEQAAAPASWRLEIGALLLLLLVALPLLLRNLSYPLLDPDETRYAQIALEMNASGDWVTPTLDGETYLDKPPLLYWITAASMRVFGENERAARLPCVFAALLTVLTTYVLGRRLVGFRAAWFSALALLLSGGYVLAGRFLLMDGPLTLFTTAALLTGWLACRRDRLHLGWWLAAGAACGLGVLTKGPIAVVLVVPPLLAARCLSGDGVRLRLWHAALFVAPIVLMTAPWFAAINEAHDEFVGYFLWKHHVVRFLSAFNHHEPWWFYLPVLLLGTFPLSLLAGPLLVFLFSRAPELRRLRTPELGFVLISAAWVVFFFSLSSCKLPTYILPALPLIGLLMGTMFDRMMTASDMRTRLGDFLRGMPRPASITVLAVGAAAAIVDLAVVERAPAGRLFDVLVILAAAIGMALIWRIRFVSSQAAWTCWTSVSLAVIAFGLTFFLPSVSRQRSVHHEAAQLHERNASAPVVYFRHQTHSAELYLDPKAIVYFREDQQPEFEAFLQSCPQAVVVSTPATAEAMQKSLRGGASLEPARSEFVYLFTSRDEAAARLSSRPAPGPH